MMICYNPRVAKKIAMAQYWYNVKDREMIVSLEMGSPNLLLIANFIATRGIVVFAIRDLGVYLLISVITYHPLYDSDRRLKDKIYLLHWFYFKSMSLANWYAP